MTDPTATLHHGDLFDVLPTLAEASIDACVTDPPYGIGFMGREWDTFKPGEGEKRIVPNRAKDSDNPNVRGRTRGPASSPSAVEYNRSLGGQREFQGWCERWAREVYRVLKPGAHLLVCGAPRSFHRMTCGLEDAGFEIRDCFSYLFGSGFPKSTRVNRDPRFCQCDELVHNAENINRVQSPEHRNDRGVAVFDDAPLFVDVLRLRGKDPSSPVDYQLVCDSNGEPLRREEVSDLVSPPLREDVQERNHCDAHAGVSGYEQEHTPFPAQYNDPLSSLDSSSQNYSETSKSTSTPENMSDVDTCESHAHKLRIPLFLYGKALTRRARLRL